jgi:hypothetical protein
MNPENKRHIQAPPRNVTKLVCCISSAGGICVAIYMGSLFGLYLLRTDWPHNYLFAGVCTVLVYALFVAALGIIPSLPLYRGLPHYVVTEDSVQCLRRGRCKWNLHIQEIDSAVRERYTIVLGVGKERKIMTLFGYSSNEIESIIRSIMLFRDAHATKGGHKRGTGYSLD